MFSNSTKYAIRTILYLSQHEADDKKTVGEIAAVLKIPRPYLSKILQQLSRIGIISSTKGRGGGFYLSNENLKRPLIDVIVTIDGHNVFDKCMLGLPNCSDKNPCRLHFDYKKFKTSLEKTICEESIEDLIKDSSDRLKF